jgi:hypothetical protein
MRTATLPGNTHRVTNAEGRPETDTAEETTRERARDVTERVYGDALRATAAGVVLVIIGGLAYLLSIDQMEGADPILYAGVILGYALNAALRRCVG